MLARGSGSPEKRFPTLRLNLTSMLESCLDPQRRPREGIELPDAVLDVAQVLGRQTSVGEQKEQRGAALGLDRVADAHTAASVARVGPALLRTPDQLVHGCGSQSPSMRLDGGRHRGQYALNPPP